MEALCLKIDDKDFTTLVKFVHSNYGIDLNKKGSLSKAG